MSVVHLRLPELGDLPVVEQWQQQQSTEDVEPFYHLGSFAKSWSKQVRQSCTKGHRGFLIIEDQQQVIGILSWSTDESMTTYFLETEISVFFAPEFRFQGYGKALLASPASAITQYLPTSSFFMEVDKRNLVAVNMMKNTGWTIADCKDPSWLRITPSWPVLT